MKNDILLTIIIPLYNVEKYISRCLESVFNQDFDSKKYEVIIVDDCSKDDSIDIVLKFKEKYQNIVLINHKHNQGLGAARNTGLIYSKGKYVWFIDSDDFIKTNSLSRLIYFLVSHNLDVISFNFYKQNEKNVFYADDVNVTFTTNILDGKTYLHDYYQPSVFSSWSKIFRKEYLIKNNFSFPEGVYWEDADFVVKSIYFAERVQFIPDHIYYYCFNDQSISRTLSGKKYADLVKMGARKLEFSKSIEHESPQLAKAIRKDAAWNATTIKRVIFLSRVERKFFYQQLHDSVYDEIKATVPLYMKLLYKYSKLFSMLFVLISPIIIKIKKIKR